MHKKHTRQKCSMHEWNHHETGANTEMFAELKNRSASSVEGRLKLSLQKSVLITSSMNVWGIDCFIRFKLGFWKRQASKAQRFKNFGVIKNSELSNIKNT